MKQGISFLNQGKAVELIDSLDDPILKVLLQMAITKVLIVANEQAYLDKQGSDQAILPEDPFDLLFYIKVMEALFEPSLRNRIKHVIEGDPVAMKGEFEDL